VSPGNRTWQNGGEKHVTNSCTFYSLAGCRGLSQWPRGLKYFLRPEGILPNASLLGVRIWCWTGRGQRIRMGVGMAYWLCYGSDVLGEWSLPNVETGAASHPACHSVLLSGYEEVWTWNWPLPSCIADVENEWSFIAAPPICFIAWTGTTSHLREDVIPKGRIMRNIWPVISGMK
jgi:hypothetical protein